MRQRPSKSLPFQKEMRILLPLKSELDFFPCLPCAEDCSPEGIDSPQLWFQATKT